MERYCHSCGASFVQTISGVQNYCSDRCRFMSFVDTTPGHGPRGACWIWKGTQDGLGYGHFRLNGRMEKAQRAALKLLCACDPAEQLACHSCDNRACINPQHIFLGSHDDNAKDCVAKGRSPRGERNFSAVLTEKQVLAIRKATGSYAQIARQFGVSKGAISHIRTYRNWRHI